MEKNVVKVNVVKAPATKGEISRKFMVEYIKEHGSVEDKNWFVKTCRSNVVIRDNNLRKAVKDDDTKETKYTSINLKIVREDFCCRFEEFYTLSDAYKREQIRANAWNFENELLALEEELGSSAIAVGA